MQQIKVSKERVSTITTLTRQFTVRFLAFFNFTNSKQRAERKRLEQYSVKWKICYLV